MGERIREQGTPAEAHPEDLTPDSAGRWPASLLPNGPVHGAVCIHWMVPTFTSVRAQALSRHSPVSQTCPSPIITPCWLTNTLPKSCPDIALTTAGVMIFS
ncbi:hypothetical protein G6F68_015153 [Rhizopus microsporus]|nr:hypothetical protein G6F68_015153 [Rhizopus microsporus]